MTDTALRGERTLTTHGGRPLRFRRRTVALLAATSLFGVASFSWPLFVRASPAVGAAHSADAPWILLGLLPLLLAILVGEMADGTRMRPCDGLG